MHTILRLEREDADDIEIETRTFDFKEIREQGVLDLINDLQTNKASGLDNIPASLIKPVSRFIVKPLTHIYNLSLMQGKVPSQFKMSRVSPIFKGGDKCDMGNYRPISVLPIFAKILEKLVFQQSYQYFIDNSLLDEN